MSIVNRRAFAATMLVGGMSLAAGPAMTQSLDRRPGGPRGDGMPTGPAERQHAMDTLAVGAVALETSRLALDRARNPLVREFADFEAEEQTTVAQIIREMTGGMAPPPMASVDRRMIERLGAARGPLFDREYILGQTDGHRKLLTIQDRYLSDGREPHQRHLAMLARGRINEHLRDLNRLQRLR